MIVNKINKTEVTSDDLKSYNEAISKLDGITFSGNDVGIAKRIITLRFGGEYDELTLVNPVITERYDIALTAEKNAGHFFHDHRRKPQNGRWKTRTI
mgnify:CR=1 FL=1